MKLFKNDQELNEFIRKNYEPLEDYEEEILTSWATEFIEDSGFTAMIYESEEEKSTAIQFDLIDHGSIEFIRVHYLFRNLKQDFEDVFTEEDLQNIVNTIKDPCSFLIKVIDVKGVSEDILDQDGIGHLLNRYDGEEIVLFHKETGKVHTLTLT